MRHDVTIRFEGMPVSGALRDTIHRHATKLWQFAPQLQSYDVAVRHAEHRHQHGNRYAVHVHAVTSGATFEAGRTPPKDHRHEDVYVAVHDAFEAMRRQLSEHARGRREGVRDAGAVYAEVV
ncbi:HPF/RaiA family ribosome-associated protein [Lysobacter sp. MMG2]|uniref:HPF/RaiA family ribosome-associated protein n=1 Tax=Lysobacter sp. MMG2 TaxID=2801338 RepID=UPI001C22883E|nr:HPF/RaiA family ribosome-associated protein [Lysobacter sp. MMG2]MBU8974820.1 HPF/RaiA family ribosome-associated protein [Lysobacter sp. MMG2]